MSLKDRIKLKKEARNCSAKTEYVISVSKVAKAITNTQSAEDLGNITREFAKFLSSLEAKNTKIVFTGEFDMGQKTLLNCILASFLEDAVETTEDADSQEDVLETKLIQKRRSLKSKLANKADSDNV